MALRGPSYDDAVTGALVALLAATLLAVGWAGLPSLLPGRLGGSTEETRGPSAGRPRLRG
jgi:hypothetical protein